MGLSLFRSVSPALALLQLTLSSATAIATTTPVPWGVPPPGYTTPPFPSLYWPVTPRENEASFLYHLGDIWRFTLLWTLVLYAAFHLVSGFYAYSMVPGKLSLGIPLVFAVMGGIEATMAGSIGGLMWALTPLSFHAFLRLAGTNTADGTLDETVWVPCTELGISA